MKIRQFVIHLGGRMPAQEVAYHKCAEALSGLHGVERELILIRLAHGYLEGYDPLRPETQQTSGEISSAG